MRLRELQALMRVRYSQPGLSRLVQRMEADGWSTASTSPPTAAPPTVRLTRAGRARTARRAPCTTGPSSATSARSSDPADARALAEALDRIATARRPD